MSTFSVPQEQSARLLEQKIGMFQGKENEGILICHAICYITFPNEISLFWGISLLWNTAERESILSKL